MLDNIVDYLPIQIDLAPIMQAVDMVSPGFHPFPPLVSVCCTVRRGHLSEDAERGAHLRGGRQAAGLTAAAAGAAAWFGGAKRVRQNAGHQARLKAGARHERTLEAVACMPWFGAAAR
jgi:hypothetical protein